MKDFSIIKIQGKEYIKGICFARDNKFNEDLGGEPELLTCPFIEPLDDFISASQIVSVKYESQEKRLGKTHYYGKEGEYHLDIFFNDFLKFISDCHNTNSI